MKPLKIVAISDTHNRYNKLVIPECDILISAGDYSFQGTVSEVRNFHKWLNKQQAKHKISVQGNHERYVEINFDLMKSYALEECPGVHFIDEGLIVIDGLKIWCSAITPWFCDWAWNRARHESEALIRKVPLIKPHWDRIPDDINILITHGPPLGILDQLTWVDGTPRSDRVGCHFLRERIRELKDLDLHFFGHIHHWGGHQVHEDGVSFYNAAICDETYFPSNPITIVDYIKD